MKEFWCSLRRVFDTTIDFQQYLGWVCLMLMVGVIAVGTVLRYFFSAPWVFTEELVKSLYIPLSFLPLAFIAKSSRHINIDLIIRHLPRNLVDWLEISSLFFIIIFSSVYCVQTWVLIEHSLRVGLVLETLPFWPRASFQIVMLIGMALFALWAIVTFSEKFSKKLRGRRA